MRRFIESLAPDDRQNYWRWVVACSPFMSC